MVRHGDPELIHPLSLAAAHCMGEVTLSTETRESAHKYPNDTVDKVSLALQKTLVENMFEEMKRENVLYSQDSSYAF